MVLGQGNSDPQAAVKTQDNAANACPSEMLQYSRALPTGDLSVCSVRLLATFDSLCKACGLQAQLRSAPVVGDLLAPKVFKGVVAFYYRTALHRTGRFEKVNELR